MSTPVSGNEFYTAVESNPKNNTMLKSTTLKVGGTAYIHFLEAKGAHHGGDLLVDGYLEVKDNNSVGSTFEKDLQVDGSTLLNGILDVPNALSTLESLEVTNGSTLNGLLTVMGGIARQPQEITASGTTLGPSDSDELIYFNNVAGVATFQIRLPQALVSRGLKFRLTASGAVNVGDVELVAFPGDTMEGTILNGAGAAGTIVSGNTVTATTTTVIGDFVEISTQGVNMWYISGVSRVAGAIS